VWINPGGQMKRETMMNDEINTLNRPLGASDSALEARARRVAKKIGLIATKSRWRRDSVDNYGGFRLVDLYSNCVEAGVRFDLSAQDVIDYCKDVGPEVES
jgi:hypothetical protein